MPSRKIRPSSVANTDALVRKINATINGARTMAVMTRCFSIGGGSTRAGGGGRGRDAAETPFATRVVVERAVEFGGIHIGPKGIGEIQLRIGKLPQQEIADPVFAPGTDEKVGRRHVGEAEVRRQRGFVDG